METLTLIHIGRAREVFQDVIILFTPDTPFSLYKGYINLYIWWTYDVNIPLIMGGGGGGGVAR